MRSIRLIPTTARRGLVLLGLLIGWADSPAESFVEPALEILHLAVGETSPAATIEDVAWLEGRRIGAAFGGSMEEIWAPPEAGAMVGMVRLVRGDAVLLYEVALVRERAGSLVMQLKHLAPDLGVWDEGNDMLEFPLVKLAPQTAYFEGLTYQRARDGTLTILLEVKNRAGETRVETFGLQPVALVEGGGR